MLKGDVLPHLVQMQFKKLEKQKPDRELPNPDASIASFNPQSKGMLTRKPYCIIITKMLDRYFRLCLRHQRGRDNPELFSME